MIWMRLRGAFGVRAARRAVPEGRRIETNRLVAGKSGRPREVDQHPEIEGADCDISARAADFFRFVVISPLMQLGIILRNPRAAGTNSAAVPAESALTASILNQGTRLLPLLAMAGLVEAMPASAQPAASVNVGANCAYGTGRSIYATLAYRW